jgi:hypothetical protein
MTRAAGPLEGFLSWWPLHLYHAASSCVCCFGWACGQRVSVVIMSTASLSHGVRHRHRRLIAERLVVHPAPASVRGNGDAGRDKHPCEGCRGELRALIGVEALRRAVLPPRQNRTAGSLIIRVRPANQRNRALKAIASVNCERP